MQITRPHQRPTLDSCARPLSPQLSEAPSHHSPLPKVQLEGQAGPGFPSDSMDIGEGPLCLSTFPLPCALQTQPRREG